MFHYFISFIVSFALFGVTGAGLHGGVMPAQIEQVIQAHQPNELGEIMVVMYHNLVESEEEEGYYARSYANFEKDLLRLHKEGYVPITMGEWIDGSFDVPAGKTPIVLTFDDGHPTDIQLDANGKPTEKCVVGIMEKVAKQHPDFVPKATFYLNGPAAFGDAEYDKKKIDYLLSNGYEIANHTSNHLHLNEITVEEAKEEIVGQAKRLEPFTGSKAFHFALPFGQKPLNYGDLVKGDWLGDYKMISSVNVGWNPVPSIFDKDFDVHNINRVTCGEDEVELYFWLDNFEAVPKTRFISDGMPGVITFPLSQKEHFDSKFASRGMKPAVYDDETLKIVEE